MRRAALYSRSARSRAVIPDAPLLALSSESLPTERSWRKRLAEFITGHRVPLITLAVVTAGVCGGFLQRQLAEPATVITQEHIDQAVRRSLEEKPLPAQSAKAFETIRPSVVRVVGANHPEATGSLPDQAGKPIGKKSGKPKGAYEGEGASIGTGVVITEKGAILTNLHVVSGTSRITLTFADGTESEAAIVGVDADNDLAVLQAQKLPDDLQPATLVTTGDLRPGDEVVAVGFPFGFGPSASAGVVSGLKREFRSTDGQRVLSNLIQFDAAANPGNSGGPLVNSQGEVLGIVTAILNPLQRGFFVGLAFAVPIENAAAAVGVHPF